MCNALQVVQHFLFFILLTFVVELDVKRRRVALVARPNCVFPALVLLLGGPLFCAGVLGLVYVFFRDLGSHFGAFWAGWGGTPNEWRRFLLLGGGVSPL